MKTPEQLHAQREMDEEILFFVRQMQNSAPITLGSVASYLKHTRRRRIIASDVELRLDYLVDKGFLKSHEEWVAGSGNETYYEITAEGSDVLDGVKPWN